MVRVAYLYHAERHIRLCNLRGYIGLLLSRLLDDDGPGHIAVPFTAEDVAVEEILARLGRLHEHPRDHARIHVGADAEAGAVEPMLPVERRELE